MAVGTRRFGRFGPGRQPEFQLLLPGAEIVRQPVAQPGFFQGPVQVIRKIDGGLDQPPVFQCRRHYLPGSLTACHSGQNGQRIDVLRIAPAAGCVGVKAARSIPVFAVGRGFYPVRNGCVVVGHRRQAEGPFHLRGRIEGDCEKQVLKCRVAGLFPDRLSPVKTVGPICKEPVWHVIEASVRFKPLLEPCEDIAVGRKQRFQIRFIAAVAPVIMAHTNPPEGEGGDELVAVCRIAAHRQAVGRH